MASRECKRPDGYGQLLALLAGGGGQDFVIDIFDPLSPLVEPAVLAALAHR